MAVNCKLETQILDNFFRIHFEQTRHNQKNRRPAYGGVADLFPRRARLARRGHARTEQAREQI